MGKKPKSDFYKVHSIAGIKTDEVTGELRFLVKWSGFSKEYDTWEPLHNLRNVEDMLRNYLLKHGYEPDSILTGSIPSQISSSISCSSDSDAEFVPYPVSAPKHRSSSEKKQKLTVPQTVESEQPPPVKTEKVFETHHDPFQMLTDFMTPIQTKPQTVANNCKQQNDDSTNVFSGIKPRPGNLDYDRPAKIVGVRRGENGLEYSILFKSNEKEMIGINIVQHEDLIQKAPWLFSLFFLANGSLTI